MEKYYSFTKNETTIIFGNNRIIVKNSAGEKTFDKNATAKHMAILNNAIEKTYDNKEALTKAEEVVNIWGI